MFYFQMPQDMHPWAAGRIYHVLESLGRSLDSLCVVAANYPEQTAAVLKTLEALPLSHYDAATAAQMLGAIRTLAVVAMTRGDDQDVPLSQTPAAGREPSSEDTVVCSMPPLPCRTTVEAVLSERVS